jgi:type I restriction enzyme S subunit
MSATPAIDVQPEQWAIVERILRRRIPRFEVWAFGSRARRTAKKYSDLDLCVVADEALGLDLQAQLAEDFAESDLPWKVDLVDWANTSEAFRQIIRSHRVVVQAGSSANHEAVTGGAAKPA